MEYKHINDCWAAIREAKTIEEVKNLFLKVMLSEIQKINYGNARTVRNVLDKTIDQHAYNLMENVISQKDKNIIVPEDICLPIVTPNIPKVETISYQKEKGDF
jgi:hypothetical protein